MRRYREECTCLRPDSDGSLGTERLREHQGRESLLNRAKTPRLFWVISLILAAVLVENGAAAQDCDYIPDWSDIQFFQECLKDSIPEYWYVPGTSTVLHSVAQYTNNPAIIDLMLEAGFDVNAREYPPLTPLHRSARNPNAVVTLRLLAAGADPNARSDDGSTPLHHSAENPTSVVTSHLLAAGADPNARERQGLYRAPPSHNQRQWTCHQDTARRGR